MKIAYCLHSTFNSGGMERIILNKANYLAIKGYDITIITTEQKEKSSFFPLNQNVKTIDLGINYSDDNNVNFFYKFCSFIKKRMIHKKRLEHCLLKNKFDIVISTFGNEVTMLPLIKDGSKKIVEIHFSRYFRLQLSRKGLWKLVDLYRTYKDQEVVKRYDKFVVLTEEDKKYWNMKNNIVIPNFLSNYPNKVSSLQNHQVIAVGRLSYQKGFDRLITAWVLIKKHYPYWNLKIFGSGELKEKLMKQIELLDLKDVIEIHPPTVDINSHYINSSIYALSSHYEGLPMVLLEAMSCGLPIVSFSCKCGPKDLITNNKNGYLIEEGNIKELANKLMTLMASNELRRKMGICSYKKSLEYSDNVIMNKWIDLFENLTC